MDAAVEFVNKKVQEMEERKRIDEVFKIIENELPRKSNHKLFKNEIEQISKFVRFKLEEENLIIKRIYD